MQMRLFTHLLGQPEKITPNEDKRTILADLEEAKAELFCAEQEFKMAADTEMIDLCVYRLKSAQERCNYLLRLAKNIH